MNSILEKAVTELQKETPNIDYVRGMLETVLAMGFSSTVEQRPSKPSVAGSSPVVPAMTDIPSVNVEHIKKIAEQSKEA